MFAHSQLAGMHLLVLGLVAGLSTAAYIYAAPLVPVNLMPRRCQRRLRAFTAWAPRAMVVSLLVTAGGAVLLAAGR